MCMFTNVTCTEMVEFFHISARTDLGYKGSMIGKYYMFEYHELIQLDKEHMLYIAYDRNMCTYAVTNAKSKITLVLSTIAHKGYQKINVVEAKKKNTYSAVKLYTYLIKNLGITLVTDKQSEGGQRIWQNLCKVEGISVYGWDFKTDTPINTDTNLEDIDDLYVNQDIKHRHADIARINLVATGV